MQPKTTIVIIVYRFNMAVIKTYFKNMLEEVGRKENLHPHTISKWHELGWSWKGKLRCLNKYAIKWHRDTWRAKWGFFWSAFLCFFFHILFCLFLSISLFSFELLLILIKWLIWCAPLFCLNIFCGRVSHPMELELKTVKYCHVDAES